MNFDFEKKSESEIPVNKRIRDKLVEFILLEKVAVLSQRNVSSSPERLDQVKKMIATGELTEVDFNRMLSHVGGPINFDEFEIISANMIYHRLEALPDEKSVVKDLARYFLNDEFKLLTPEIIRDLLEKYPSPQQLELAIAKCVNEPREIQLVLKKVKPAFKLLYGKKLEYWDQIKSLKEISLYDYGDMSKGKKKEKVKAKDVVDGSKDETKAVDIENETDQEVLVDMLKTLYKGALTGVKARNIPLNDEVFMNPAFAEALRETSLVQVILLRLAKLKGVYDNKMISALRHEALDELVGKSDEVDVEDSNSGFEFAQSVVENFSFHELTAQDSEKVLARTEIHGDEYEGEFLRTSDLAERGLEPKYEIELDDIIVLASDLYDLGSGRVGCVAFVEYGGGYVARSYYQSNSQTSWRYLPGYAYSDMKEKLVWFNKAYDEASIDAPIVLQKALAEIKKVKEPKEVDNPEFVLAGTVRSSFDEGTFVQRVASHPSALKGNFYYKHNISDRMYGNEIVEPETMVFENKDHEPDLGKVLTSWEDDTSLYGHVQFEVFQSNNGDLRYVFCRDDLGRAWISSVENNSEITSVGVRKEWVDAGFLTMPAYEYHSQTSGYGNRELIAGEKGDYQDMYKNFISKIPIIKEYQSSVKKRTSKKIIKNEIEDYSRIIKAVHDFGSLLSLIRRTKGIVGRKRTYEPEYLVSVVEGVMIGKYDVTAVTKEQGLRDKVMELLKKREIDEI